MADAALQLLLDKKALDDLIRRQATAVDRQDWSTYCNCYAEKIDVGAFTEHMERLIGRRVEDVSTASGWLELVKAVTPGFDGAMHRVTNIVHTIDGDHSRSRCYFVAETYLNNRSGGRSAREGQYHEFEAVRTEAGWKLKTRRTKYIYAVGNPAIFPIAVDKVREREQQSG